MAEHKCYDVTIVRIKPKYAMCYLGEEEKRKCITEKHGGKVLGSWMTEGGPNMEHVFLRTWPSVDARHEAIHKMLSDPELMAWFAKTGKYTQGYTSYLCLSHPLMPLKALPAGERIYMEQIGYKASPIAAAQKYKEVNEKWAAMSGGSSSALGLLAPTTFDKPSLFGFHATPGGKMNGVAELWEQCLAKAEVFPLIDDYYSQIQDQTARILMPLPNAAKPDAPCAMAATAAPVVESAKDAMAAVEKKAEEAVKAVEAAVPAALEGAKAAVQGAADAVLSALPGVTTGDAQAGAPATQATATPTQAAAPPAAEEVIPPPQKAPITTAAAPPAPDAAPPPPAPPAQ